MYHEKHCSLLSPVNREGIYLCFHLDFLVLASSRVNMSDKSDLKAELERKKQRLAQIREEKKRKEEERKKKEVNMQKDFSAGSCLQKGLAELLTSQWCMPQGICHVA